MQNNIKGPLKKTGLELLSINCALILLISSFSFTVLAENTNVSGNVTIDDKISTSLSSKITEATPMGKIPVIILLTDQTIPFNTIAGRTKIELL